MTWPVEDLEILARRYPTEKTEELARDLGRTVAAVTSKANKLGICKSVTWRELTSPSVQTPTFVQTAHGTKTIVGAITTHTMRG